MVPGLISVVLPNYNHGKYVGGAIAAILAQSYRNLELVVYDDASTDNSVEVIKAAIAGDSRARFVQNEKNVGPLEIWYRALKIATGEFINFQSADDLVIPGFLDKSIAMLYRFPQASLCHSTMAWLHDTPTGPVAQPMPVKLIPTADYLTPDRFCEVITGEKVSGHPTVFRREAFEATLPPLEDYLKLRWGNDTFIGTIMACRTGICHIPEPLVALRSELGTNFGKGWENYEDASQIIYQWLRLLKSPRYCDVIPCVVKGQLFAFIPQVGRAVLSNPEFWDRDSLLMTAQPIMNYLLERTIKRNTRWQR